MTLIKKRDGQGAPNDIDKKNATGRGASNYPDKNHTTDFLWASSLLMALFDAA